MTVYGHGMEGSNKLLCQLPPERQGTSHAFADLFVRHNKVLHEVRIVYAQHNAIVQYPSVRSEGLSADAAMFDDVCQVHPSHVVVVVMQKRWGRNIDQTIGSTASDSAICIWHVCRILRRMHVAEEVDLLAVKPALSKQVAATQIVGRASNMVSSREVNLPRKASSPFPDSPARIYSSLQQQLEEIW